MKKLLTAFILFMITTMSFSQVVRINSEEKEITLQTSTGSLFGTLSVPNGFTKGPLVVIIAGSGPTDRNCNNPMAKCNAYKLLADEFSKNGIASFRYDKRGIAKSAEAGQNEANLRFDHYVEDAKAWIHQLKQDPQFSEIVVLGHSEGSLIGMLAAAEADKFVSVAGPGQSADKILKTQLGAQPKEVQDYAFPIIDSLANGKTVDNVNPMYYALFRPSVQPYMISWFKYDPQAEIRKLSIPVLIIQGTNDVQVSVEDARLLAGANPKARLVLIEKMNHIFRFVDGDRQANLATYNNPELPLMNELVRDIVGFVR